MACSTRAFPEPFPTPIMGTSRGFPPPASPDRDDSTEGSWERETRLELATSSLEGMFTESSSDWAMRRSRARYFSFCCQVERGRGARRVMQYSVGTRAVATPRPLLERRCYPLQSDRLEERSPHARQIDAIIEPGPTSGLLEDRVTADAPPANAGVARG
jgi:hypothetical protein